MTTDLQAFGAKKFAELQRESMRQESWRESISGPGSTTGNARLALLWLEKIVHWHGNWSILDVPCGDHNWMSRFPNTVDYLGLDILEEPLAMARLRAPHRKFIRFNAIEQVPPKFDLILCRDFLVHLTSEHALKVLKNFRASGSKYLAITSFPNVTANAELIESHPGWGWRPLNMSIAPFKLGEPIDFVNEDEGQGKTLALFKL